MRTATAFLIVLWLTLAGAPPALRAGSGSSPLKLPATAEVSAQTISLADLLPPMAPGAIRRRAAAVLLGNSPQPGTVRILDRSEIQYRLQRMPGLLGALQIPNRIAIRRAHRTLSLEEMRRAIVRALKQQGFTDSEMPPIRDLEAPAAVPVILKDPGLVVKGIAFDPVRKMVRFRLYPAKEPKALPFYVTVRRPGEHLLWLARRIAANGSRLAGAAPGMRAVRRASASSPRVHSSPDVRPGKSATMVIEGPGIRILTEVMPLQNGFQGQQIRVRDVETKRILRAEVVAKNYVRQTLF